MATVTGAMIVDDRAVIVMWEGLGSDDDGKPADIRDFTHKTVQVSGTFGSGGSINLEGSNDGTTWAILDDKDGAAITLTAAGMVAVDPTQVPLHIRPHVTAGDGTTDLDVILTASRA